ncbi:hypothetical protein [Burkholderia sp. BCC0405]|uniref:hypothetical protein n=1 Tax=Burkholderia sp. BCC0405 TaxID=2676298 RepID=UPI00158BD957|nr:hypothetical protein [Burkholderia sp. BCC0405]
MDVSSACSIAVDDRQPEAIRPAAVAVENDGEVPERGAGVGDRRVGHADRAGVAGLQCHGLSHRHTFDQEVCVDDAMPLHPPDESDNAQWKRNGWGDRLQLTLFVIVRDFQADKADVLFFDKPIQIIPVMEMTIARVIGAGDRRRPSRRAAVERGDAAQPSTGCAGVSSVN